MNKYYLLFIVASLGVQLAHGMDNNQKPILLSFAAFLQASGLGHEVVSQSPAYTRQNLNEIIRPQEQPQMLQNLIPQNQAPREQPQMLSYPAHVVINNHHHVTNNIINITSPSDKPFKNRWVAQLQPQNFIITAPEQTPILTHNFVDWSENGKAPEFKNNTTESYARNLEKQRIKKAQKLQDKANKKNNK